MSGARQDSQVDMLDTPMVEPQPGDDVPADMATGPHERGGERSDRPARCRTLEDYRQQLIAHCRAEPGVTSLVFFGSSANTRAQERDAWSDLDFNLFFTPAASDRLRAEWSFLPERDRVVLAEREGDNGGVALYDDGTLFEFGAGRPWEIRDPVREVVLDGGDLRWADPPIPPTASQAVRLFLVKLYIGMGRLRRGERVAASAHIRTRAVQHLCWALRLRLAPDADVSLFDPVRRFELALPELAVGIADAQDRDLEACGRALYALARDTLEPGWAEFPSGAADVIAHRVGWLDARSTTTGAQPGTRDAADTVRASRQIDPGAD